MGFLDALRAFWRRLLALGPGAPLCDRCKWDYGDVCKRPERPNARRCPDFEQR
jgi:hypothetical protein